MNIVTILTFYLGSRIDLILLPVGAVLAIVAQLLFLIPFVKQQGYKHKPILDFDDRHIKTMALLALPVIIGTSVNEINILIDRTLASSIAIGGISALNYSRRLNGFVTGLFVTSVTTVLYPLISRKAAAGDVAGLKSSVSEAISMVNILLLPATIGAMIFSSEIVTLLFGRGAFTQDAIALTASAVFYYSIAMTASGLRDILSQTFYALQDTKTPMINATIGVVINIVLNIILSKFMGIGGLALATSISAIITAILMFITLRKKIGPFGLKELIRSFIKITIATVIMGMLALGSFKFIGNYISQNYSLILAIGIGALAYVAIIYFMKIPEVDLTIEAIKKKLLAYKQEQS